MDEQTILNSAYYILEQDNSGWEEDSSEYLTARGILKLAIIRWENFDNTIWKELFKKLSVVGETAEKTIVDNTYTYDCPDSFVKLLSWVRTTDSAGHARYWRPIPPQELAHHAQDSTDFCYITGNKKDGFTLSFNPNATLPEAGSTIDYEFKAKATYTTDEADEIEMSNPDFAAYFVASHMADGGIDQTFFNIAESLLQEMKDTNDDDGFFNVAQSVGYPTDEVGGFGT